MNILESVGRLVFIGKELDRLRREQGLSFEELGIRSGMTSRQLRKIISGASGVRMESVFKICDGLGCRNIDFFKCRSGKWDCVLS